jgi:hypothetical protein
MEGETRGSWEWGIAGHSKPGFSESGDACWVRAQNRAGWLAVIDGAGHGPIAFEVAQTAVRVLNENSFGSPAEGISRCHQALLGTRGCVMALAQLNPETRTVTWVGVGNIAGVLLHKEGNSPVLREPLPMQEGGVGVHLPSLRPATLAFYPGDYLILVTDGVRSNFASGGHAGDSTQAIADSLLQRYSRGTDDALVAVIRYQE